MNSRREALLAGIRGMLPILLGVLPFGLIAGAATVSVGLSPLGAIGMSIFVFAGMAQLAAVELVGKDAAWLVVLATALVVNLRFVMYSAAVAPHLRHLPLRWKVPLAYILSDQAFVVSMARFDDLRDPRLRVWFYFGTAATLWTAWQVAFGIGAVLGASVPASWSLDFAVPLTLMALMPASVRDSAAVLTVVVTGVAAWFTQALPLNLGTIAAVVIGVAVGGLYLRSRGELVPREKTA